MSAPRRNPACHVLQGGTPRWRCARGGCRPRWRASTAGSTCSPPASSADSNVYIAQNTGEMIIYRAKTKAAVQTTGGLNSSSKSPTVPVSKA
eukprot:scaffold62295_cov33-Prasinocladus_malaysianus.AAC.1